MAVVSTSRLYGMVMGSRSDMVEARANVAVLFFCKILVLNILGSLNLPKLLDHPHSCQALRSII